MTRQSARRTEPAIQIPKVQEVQPPRAAPEVELPKPVYSFPNKARCPRCGGVETKAYASKDGVQSRICEAPICRWRWKVIGTPV